MTEELVHVASFYYCRGSCQVPHTLAPLLEKGQQMTLGGAANWRHWEEGRGMGAEAVQSKSSKDDFRNKRLHVTMITEPQGMLVGQPGVALCWASDR